MPADVILAPSLLAADPLRLGDEVRAVTQAGADWLHVDVMDGHFVPNLSCFGPASVAALRATSALPLDVHLMISPVDPLVPAFARAGAARITAHVEAGPHLDRTLQLAREHGCAAGVALNPHTHESALAYLLDGVDLVLVMTVNPGFGGQAFLPGMLAKVRRVREMIGERPIRIEVDGGINAETARACVAAGADVLVGGSSVFKGDDYAATLGALRDAAKRGQARSPG